MKQHSEFTCVAFWALGVALLVLSSPTASLAQDPFPIASAGGVTMFVIPQEAPSRGFSANKVVLRADNPTDRIITFEKIQIDGAHQLWSSLGGPNVLGPQSDPIYADGWSDLDTHLLITEEMIGGGVYAFSESNTKSIKYDDLPTTLGGEAFAIGGIGAIEMSRPSDAFFLEPEFQSDTVDLAYVVSRWDSAFDPTISVGVLGQGILNSGEPRGAFFDRIPLQILECGPAKHTCTFCQPDSGTCFDFARDPSIRGTLVGDAEWRSTGGVEDGYLELTGATENERGTFIIPTDGPGTLVLSAQTNDKTSAHHVDNLSLTEENGRIQISMFLRIGGGSNLPGSGMSVSYVAIDDPILAADGNGFAGINGQSNLAEEGSTTGLSVSLDEFQTGGLDPPTPPTQDGRSEDVVGITVRHEGKVIGQYSMPTFNGALDDAASIQSGPNSGGLESLGWADLRIDAPAPLAGGDIAIEDVIVTYKRFEIPLVIPEPNSRSQLAIAAVLLALLRNRTSRRS